LQTVIHIRRRTPPDQTLASGDFPLA